MRSWSLAPSKDTDLIGIGIIKLNFLLKDPVSHALWKQLEDSHLFLPVPWKIEILPLLLIAPLISGCSKMKAPAFADYGDKISWTEFTEKFLEAKDTEP